MAPPLSPSSGALLLVGSYVFYRFLRRVGAAMALRRKRKAHGCQAVVRTPGWDPILGIDFLLQRTRNVKKHTWLAFTSQHFQSLGRNTCLLNILGKKVIFTIDPDILKAVHQTNFKSWGITPNRRARVVPFIGEGIFTNDGAHWQQSRRLLRPSFDRSRMVDVTTLERHMQELIQAVPTDGSTVDLRRLFHRFTMNSATGLLFGNEAGFVFGDEFETAFDRCLGKIGGGGKMMTLGAAKDPEYERDVKFVHDSIDIRIDQVLSKHYAESSSATNGQEAFLHQLIAETSDKLRIRSELLNNLMAGRDTSASMLANAVFELARHPEAWARLREEVDALHGSLPTHEQLQNMPYLRAVFNESMRLYPQLPENGRVALEDTVLPAGGGQDGMAPVFVPKGQVVMWGTYALHRRQDIFGDDADEFNPDRWLDTKDKAAIKPGWGYLAFGGGPRVCMGQQFAITQAAYIITRLVQTFHTIESRDPEPWIEQLALVCNGLGGCKVALQKS